MKPLDPFTRKRIQKFIEEFRSASGQLPTLKSLEEGGFSKEVVDRAIDEKTIEQFYVTLTNGTIVKGYKLCSTTSR